MAVFQKFASLLLLLLPALTGSAQHSLQGYIVSDPNGTAVTHCPVILFNTSDSSRVSEITTDSLGFYHFDRVPAGRYFLKATDTSYADYVSQEIITGDSMAVLLPGIALHRKETILNEVTVSTVQPTLSFRDGKVVLTTANNPLAAGATVIELLKNLPGITLGADNTISAGGKQGVRFLIDGVLQQMPEAQMMLLLSNMSAENVASLEWIKNPPAKYDATGTAGLINIVTRRNRIKGYNGTITGSAGMGKRFGGGANASLNFRSDKLSVFSNISYLHRNPLTDFELNRSFSSGNGMQSINTTGNDVTQLYAFNINGGLEYDIKGSTTLGASFRTLPGKSTDHFVAGGRLIHTPFPYSQTNYVTDNTDRYNNPSAVLYARHAFDTSGTQLTFTADYTHFSYRESRMNENTFYDNSAEVLPPTNNNNLLDLDFNIFTQKLDFTKRVGRTTVFESGLKSSFVKNNSDAGLVRNVPGTDSFYKDALFSSIYNYKEQIFAGYADVTKSAGRFSLQGGLRVEQTYVNAVNRSNGKSLQRNYFNVFPSLNIGYKQNDQSSFQFAYSYRIDRPAYDQLNPVRLFFSELNYGTGNPGLVPQYSHNFNLDHNYRDMLISSLAFTRYSNSVYRYTYTEMQTGIQIDTLANLASRGVLSYNLTFQKQWSGHFNMQLTGMVAYCYASGTLNETIVNQHSVTGLVNSNNDVALPFKTRLQVNGRYALPYTDGIQHYSQRGSVDVALQRRFLSDKLSMVFGIYDLFYTDYGTMHSNLPDQSYREYARNDSRRVRLTATYRFGNMRIARKVNNDDNAESKRIKKVD